MIKYINSAFSHQKRNTYILLTPTNKSYLHYPVTEIHFMIIIALKRKTYLHRFHTRYFSSMIKELFQF